MGIYVNGLWMPTSKEVLMLAITADGEVYSIGFDNTIEGGIFLSHPSIYPIKAIPVPPHGRLIDADKLCLSSGFSTATEYGMGRSDQIEAIKSNAPTVIPAEEDE